MDMHAYGMVSEIVLAFMTLDIITGYVGAWVSQSISSSKMRQGIGHKAALIVIMCVFLLIDITQSKDIIDLGFDIPLFKMSCTYIVIMEINSIFENILIIFPSLKDTKLATLFKNNKSVENLIGDSMNSKKDESDDKPYNTMSTEEAMKRLDDAR